MPLIKYFKFLLNINRKTETLKQLEDKWFTDFTSTKNLNDKNVNSYTTSILTKILNNLQVIFGSDFFMELFLEKLYQKYDIFVGLFYFIL